MTEIIKHGKYYGNKVTCTHCGCVFIASPEDYIISEKHIGGRRVVMCPECGHTISIYGDDEPYNWMNDNNTFKIHPEDDPNYKYFDIHVDKYDLSKKFNIDTDGYTDYISKINSIDNYKLPDDYVVPEGYKLVWDYDKCPMTPCFGRSDFLDKDSKYTSCILKADPKRYLNDEKSINYMSGQKKDY